MTRYRSVLLLLPLFLLLIVFVVVFAEIATVYGGPSAQGFGSDFAMFWAAARVMAHGGDPYVPSGVLRELHLALARQGVAAAGDPTLVRVGNPPLMLLAIRPLAFLPFRLAGWVWIGGQAVALILGFILLARMLGWRRFILPLAVFLAMPQQLLEVFYGNVTAVIFLCFAAAFALARRFPLLAGLFLAAGWLKPSLALPIAAAIVALHAPRWRLTAAGALLGTLLFWITTLVLVGPGSVRPWLAGLIGYGRDIAAQPENASLPGLWVHWMPAGPRTVLTVVTALLGLALAVALVRRLPPERPLDPLQAAPIWFIAFLATPYSHISDGMLLALPVMALVGPNGRRAGEPLPALVLYLLFAALLVNRIPGVPVDLEPLKLAAAGLLIWLASRRHDTPTVPQTAPATA